MNKRWLVVFAMAIVLGGLVGCVSTEILYQPPDIERNSLATVKMKDGSVGVFTVDGVQAMSSQEWVFNKFKSEVLLAPGKHTLRLAFTHNGNTQLIPDVWLVAEPGKTYVLKAVEKEGRVKSWLEDAQTGKEVGGYAGSDDEPQK